MNSPAADAQTPDRGRVFLANAVVTCVLFSLSYTTNCVQRERQADELRKQGREIAEVKALLMEQQKRRE